MKQLPFTFYIFLFFNSILFGQTPIEKIDLLLKEAQKTYPDIGISVGLLHNGNTHFSNIGKLERGGAIAINEHSIFEIASITKSLTGNLIAMAIQEGKIAPDDFIETHLPKDFQLKQSIQGTIKISDLASHQSGLPDIDFRELIAQNPQQPIASVNKGTIVSMINSCDSLPDHGQYRYSTMGFILLGQILEHIYNKSYDTLVKEKITAPLQLEHTLTMDFLVKNRTKGYNAEGGVQDFFKWNIAAPAGLIKSSASDMLQYISALVSNTGRLSEVSTLAETTYYKNTHIEIGLGINILRDKTQVVYAKTGDTMGQSSILAYDKKAQWGVILLINERNGKIRSSLFNKIYDILIKH